MAAKAKFFEFVSTFGAPGSVIPIRGIGFPPTAIIITSTGQSGSGDSYAPGDIRRCIGWATAIGKEHVVGAWQKDNVATTETRLFARDDSCILIADADALSFAAKFDGTDPDGFDLEIIDSGGPIRRFYGLALGGDIVAGVAKRNLPLVTGLFDVTGFGFGASAPEAALFLHFGEESALPVDKGRAELNFGFAASAAEQAMLGMADGDNAATTQAAAYCLGGECAARVKSSGGVDQRMAVSSFGADKVTIDLLESNDADWLFVLALRGGDFAVKEFLTKITAPADIPITGLASRAAGGIVISGFRAEDTPDSATGDDRGSVGFFSEGAPIHQGVQSQQSLSGISTSSCSHGQQNPAVYLSAKVNLDAKQGSAKVKSIEATGLTLEQLDADVGFRFGAVFTIGPGTPPAPPADGGGKISSPALIVEPATIA